MKGKKNLAVYDYEDREQGEIIEKLTRDQMNNQKEIEILEGIQEELKMAYGIQEDSDEYLDFLVLKKLKAGEVLSDEEMRRKEFLGEMTSYQAAAMEYFEIEQVWRNKATGIEAELRKEGELTFKQRRRKLVGGSLLRIRK